MNLIYNSVIKYRNYPSSFVNIYNSYGNTNFQSTSSRSVCTTTKPCDFKNVLFSKRLTSNNCFKSNKRRLLATTSYKFSDNRSWKEPNGNDTGIKIYNPILKNKVPLILKDNTATWYSCGPTVYDSAHIGHASCYVKLDIIQRILTDYFKINLITCMGVTDVDDKIINKSKETGRNINEITKSYEEEFTKNLSDLGIISPNIMTRVTDHIPTIVNFIKKLVERNLCYITTDGSVLFNTNDYRKYGKFQNPQINEHNETISNQKKSPLDFALWKGYKDGEPYWETDWGKGRPGWHIECSAMVSRLFGSCVDFHAGGIDLQFPHHENEEAQSCAFHKTDQWVNYWIHTGHLHLKNDVKMSKSLKNTISIDELLQNYGADTFRMACLISHYRHSMEFNDENMNNAKAILSKIIYFLADCKLYTNDISKENSSINQHLCNKLTEIKLAVDEALRNDFDTSKCIILILNLITETRKLFTENFDPINVVLVTKYITQIMNCFGISLVKSKESNKSDNISQIVDLAVNFRQNVRSRGIQTKDNILLGECDNFRDSLTKNKIKIRDVSKTQSNWIFEE